MNEKSKQGPAITAAELDGIDAKLKLCTDPPFEVVGARRHCGISRRGRVVVVRADEHDIDDLEAMSDLRNHADALLALARKGLEAEARVSKPWEVVGNTLYLRTPTPGQKAKQGVDWFDFPGAADWARRIADCHNAVVGEVEALRGVGCKEGGDGPCGVCLKCASARVDAAESKLAAALAELSALKAERDAAEPSKADRCVNCAFGSRACRQCRDRLALAAALAEVERLRADRTDILDRIDRTEMVYDEAYETMKLIMKDYGVGPWKKAAAEAQAAQDGAGRKGGE